MTGQSEGDLLALLARAERLFIPRTPERGEEPEWVASIRREVRTALAAGMVDPAASPFRVPQGQGEEYHGEGYRSLKVYTLCADFYLAVVVATNAYEALVVGADDPDEAGWRFLGYKEQDVNVELVPLDAPRFIASHNG